MRSTVSALTMALMFGTAGPALAQAYGATTPQTPKMESPAAKPAAATAPVGPALCSSKLGAGARKALVAYQASAATKDAAKIAAAAAAASAAVKTGDERCVLGQLMLKAAGETNDYAAASAAVDVMASSGSANPAALGPIASSVGKLRYNAKDFAGASTAFDTALRINPNDAEAYVLSGEAKAKLNQTDAALDQFNRAFAVKKAAGQPIDETWLHRAVALAFEAKSPKVFGYGRQLISAYPNAKNWREALRIYQARSGLPSSELIDIYRLQRATKSLSGESDFVNYTMAVLTKGYPGEAKTVLDEGIASSAISRSSASVGSILSQANAKAVGDRASLDSAAKAAAVDGKKAMILAEAYYGYGDFAKAAALNRAALTKSGTDAATANLHLGMALAMSGDKAGAQAALSAVTGPKAEIAQYWMTYLALRS